MSKEIWWQTSSRHNVHSSTSSARSMDGSSPILDGRKIKKKNNLQDPEVMLATVKYPTPREQNVHS